MAPLSGWKKGGQRRPKLSNASGYQIRKARSRPLKSSLGLSDVYDYEQEKIKRANVSLTLDKDEVDLAGTSGDEDDEDEDAMRRRPRLLGENGDEAIATDDDEEIDSDEAFEESDEERFAGFQFKRMVSIFASNMRTNKS
jgi:U3 small nucleolar RNA-associated protein 14